MIRVCALADLPPGESTRVVAYVPVAVFNADGELFAIDDTCTHQDASLSEGWLEDCMIECPLHAASFDLRTGRHRAPGQATRPHLPRAGPGRRRIRGRPGPAASAPAPAAGADADASSRPGPTGCGVTRRTIAVVGASLSGLRAAQELRAQGYDDDLVLVGAEPHLPYDRPPLSKDYLLGKIGADDLALAERSDIDELDARWRLGVAAERLDVTGGRVVLASGEEIAADGVVIATGGVPRRLPAAEGLLGVHVLRSLDDADALRAELTGGAQNVVVIGAGFIGAEVAATSRALGLEVTIVEAMPVPLSVALGPELGAVCAGLHATNGVPLLTGMTVVDWLTTDDGAGRPRVTAVELSDGRRLRADVVVVGIGMRAGDGMAGRLRALPRRRCSDRRRLCHRSPEHRRRGRRRPAVQPAHGPQRPPGALDGRGRGPGHRGAEPARREHRAAGRQAELLLVRPVRHPHPVRRLGRAVRRGPVPRRRPR